MVNVTGTVIKRELLVVPNQSIQLQRLGGLRALLALYPWHHYEILYPYLSRVFPLITEASQIIRSRNPVRYINMTTDTGTLRYKKGGG